MGPAVSVLLLAALLLLRQAACYPGDPGDDYTDDWKESVEVDQALLPFSKRGCIHRGGSCDHRPNDCCDNSSCRCNLWGTNCRCQRMGLFQQWGK